MTMGRTILNRSVNVRFCYVGPNPPYCTVQVVWGSTDVYFNNGCIIVNKVVVADVMKSKQYGP